MVLEKLKLMRRVSQFVAFIFLATQGRQHIISCRENILLNTFIVTIVVI